jgi:hypothetical protein
VKIGTSYCRSRSRIGSFVPLCKWSTHTIASTL